MHDFRFMIHPIRSDPVGTVCEDMVKELASALKVDTEPTLSTSADADCGGKAIPAAIAAMNTAHNRSKLPALNIYWLTLVPRKGGSSGPLRTSNLRWV